MLAPSCEKEPVVFSPLANEPKGTQTATLTTGVPLDESTIRIDGSGNFVTDAAADIFSFGPKKCLADVVEDIDELPAGGETSSVAVAAGHGYVVFDFAKDYFKHGCDKYTFPSGKTAYCGTYYKIYVTSLLKDDSGAVTGANVRYLKCSVDDDLGLFVRENSLGSVEREIGSVLTKTLAKDPQGDVEWENMEGTSVFEMTCTGTTLTFTLKEIKQYGMGGASTESGMGDLRIGNRYLATGIRMNYR